MRPATVHLIAQLIRHGRGICTAVEKWGRATPSEALAGEAGHLVAFARAALTRMESGVSLPRPEAAPDDTAHDR